MTENTEKYPKIVEKWVASLQDGELHTVRVKLKETKKRYTLIDHEASGDELLLMVYLRHRTTWDKPSTLFSDTRLKAVEKLFDDTQKLFNLCESHLHRAKKNLETVQKALEKLVEEGEVA